MLFIKLSACCRDDEGVEEILKILESRDEESEYFEEQDAISYEDFKRAVYKDGSFKKGL